jgi:hypothetical protein
MTNSFSLFFLFLIAFLLILVLFFRLLKNLKGEDEVKTKMINLNNNSEQISQGFVSTNNLWMGVEAGMESFESLDAIASLLFGLAAHKTRKRFLFSKIKVTDMNLKNWHN